MASGRPRPPLGQSTEETAMTAEEEQVLRELETTCRRIKDIARLSAAGQPLPTALHELLIALCGANLEALALTEGSTPGRIVSDWFKIAPSDVAWEPRRRKLAAEGRR